MAAALGDLIQITTVGTIDGTAQNALNVYFYRVTSLTGLSGDYLQQVWTNFRGAVIDPVRAILSQEFIFTSAELRNLSNGLDFKTIILGAAGDRGTVVSECLPSFVAYTFRLGRESLVTRNGYKRFAGVPENAGSENDYAPTAGQIAAVQNGLSADLQAGAVTYAEPVIVKRPIASPAGAYQYSSIGSSDFRGVGSQNTRKRGRGI